jgi:hypothetical protein
MRGPPARSVASFIDPSSFCLRAWIDRAKADCLIIHDRGSLGFPYEVIGNIAVILVDEWIRSGVKFFDAVSEPRRGSSREGAGCAILRRMVVMVGSQTIESRPKTNRLKPPDNSDSVRRKDGTIIDTTLRS